MLFGQMGLTQLATVVAEAAASMPETTGSPGSRGRDAFQWGGTIAAVILLISNCFAQRSSTQSSLLVLYLFTSFPTVLFEILRGQVGCWVAFLSVAANLFFPDMFPVSRLLLFVITPDWVAHGLRYSIVGAVFCLVVGLLVGVVEIREMGGCSSWECNSRCCFYCLGILLLLFFTVLYLSLGPW